MTVETKSLGLCFFISLLSPPKGVSDRQARGVGDLLKKVWEVIEVTVGCLVLMVSGEKASELGGGIGSGRA